MNSLWAISINDYLEIVKIAKADGLQAGKSMEKYFIQYMKDKGIKPAGHTELTKSEMIQEYLSHNQKVADISTDEKGNTNFKIYKPKS